MLKREIAFLAALTLCCGAFASCGSKSSSSGSVSAQKITAEPVTETTAENSTEGTTEDAGDTTDPTQATKDRQVSGGGSAGEITPDTAKGGDLRGQWTPDKSITEMDAFIEFADGGAGNLYVDLSSMVTVTDKSFKAMGIEASGDNFVFENGQIKAYYNSKDEDSLVIGLERADGRDPSELDGEYNITGGRLTSVILAYIDGEFGGDAKDVPITAVLSNGKTLLKVGGAFTYIVEGSRLQVAVMAEISDSFSFIRDKDIYYTADDEKLSIVTGDGDSTVLTRRKQ